MSTRLPAYDSAPPDPVESATGLYGLSAGVPVLLRDPDRRFLGEGIIEAISDDGNSIRLRGGRVYVYDPVDQYWSDDKDRLYRPVFGLDYEEAVDEGLLAG